MDAPVEHLIDLFFKSGMCLQGGWGNVPLTWQELDSWQRVMAIELTGWEAETIRAMSVAYVSSRQDAVEPDAVCPYAAESIVTAVQSKITQIFS